MASERKPRGLYVAAAAFLTVMVTILVTSMTRTEPPSFPPTTMEPREVSERFVVDTVTIDARDGNAWVFFDFDVGAAVDESRIGEWDLAINRFHLVTNGGSGYFGQGGAIRLERSWDDVTEAPAEGYTTTEGPLDNGALTPALDRWYTYSFFAHTLLPKDETYIVRTAEGRYGKIAILSYYCPQATPGCLTMVYGHQGDGSRRLTELDQ